MGISVSDIDKPAQPGVQCQTCGAPATDMVEWEDDDFGGRWWERFCEPCLDRALRIQRETAALEKAADDAAAARLGVDWRAFCDGCGYRACRCDHDRLTGATGYVVGVKKVAFTCRG